MDVVWSILALAMRSAIASAVRLVPVPCVRVGAAILAAALGGCQTMSDFTGDFDKIRAQFDVDAQRAAEHHGDRQRGRAF